MGYGIRYDWIDTQKKFLSLVACTKDGKPTVEHLRFNNFPMWWRR